MRLMRALLIATSTLAISLGWGQSVKLQVSTSGLIVGTAVIEQKLLADGGKQVSLTMDLKMPDGPATRSRSESVYDANGLTVRKILTVKVGDRPERRSVVTFTGNKASLLTPDSDQPLVVAASASMPLKAASEFWFIRDQPKPKERVSWYAFDETTKSWNLNDAQYLGPKTTDWMGKKTKAHLILMSRSGGKISALVDEKGLPFRIEMGQLLMERIAKPE